MTHKTDSNSIHLMIVVTSKIQSSVRMATSLYEAAAPLIKENGVPSSSLPFKTANFIRIPQRVVTQKTVVSAGLSIDTSCSPRHKPASPPPISSR